MGATWNRNPQQTKFYVLGVNAAMKQGGEPTAHCCLAFTRQPRNSNPASAQQQQR